MEQNTNETREQVGEVILQDITGGCQGCTFVGSLLVKQSQEAMTNSTRSAMNNDFRSASKEMIRHNKLSNATTRATESAGKPAIGGGFIHCENFGALVKGVSRQIRP